MRKRIVLISCVSKKLSHTSKARELYISPLFKLNLKYAEQLVPDEVFILSAQYGLLPLDKQVEPYEKTLNNMRSKEIKEWAITVLKQIENIYDLSETEFTFLAGEKYRKFLLPQMKHIQIPLKGLRIGQQLQKLIKLTS